MTELDWLGNNQLSLDIWRNKYRNGTETFEQWLDRVSGGNSEIRRLIVEKKFLFGGRILANRGLDKEGRKITLSNCFVSGSKVLCKRGLVNIEDIIIGDEVLSDDGKFHNVSNIMKRHYIGDLYKIESHEIYNPIICTPNHKFLTNWGWKRADRIFPQGVSYTNKGQDMLKTAYFDGDSYFYKAGEGEIVDLTEGYICDDKHQLNYLEDNTVQLEAYCNVSPISDKKHYVWRNSGNAINHKVTLTSDFLYFIGRWIGDGSITCRKGQKNPAILQIVFNATTEREAAERCQKIGENIFGITASVTETKQNVIAVRFESPIISSWFLKNFGEKCDGKFIPDKFLGNRDLLCGLLDADASLNTHGALKLVLKNKKLLQWVKDTCYLNGINTGQIKDISYRQEATGQLDISVTQANAKLNKYLTKDYHDKRQNKVARGNSEYIYIPSIEVLENQECDVYNISVDDSHTYTVNGVIVHNCYVLPAPEDNLESIFKCASRMARTFSYGGGVGIDVSKLRPKGAKVNNAANSTTGTTSFMDFFSYVTGLIGQEGRRGALLLSIDCTHPDLEEFINLKSDLDICTKANISIRVSDEFMQAVEKDKDWKLYFDTEHEHIEKVVKAKDIFMLLAKRNWEMAEPGILYWDRIENYNMLSADPNFKYAGCNPCCEEPLPAGGSCLLGSINLSEFVVNAFQSNSRVDFDGLEEAVAISVRALNQVLIEGILLHPLKTQRDSVYDWHQIGLGTFGLGDMLIKLGITYGSIESLEIINNIFKSIAITAVETSLQLAKVEGCYPMCNKKALVESEFIKVLNLPENTLKEIERYGLFNSQLLTCAPTGSTATMLGVSTGVEPNFAFSFTRRTVSLNKEETYYQVDAGIVRQYKAIYGECDNKDLPKYFIVSQQIDPFNRLKVQAALQTWIDASISSTLNLPEETTIEQVADIYMQAWKLGLKGITIWRDNCQRQGILTTKKEESKSSNEPITEEVSSNTENTKLQVENSHKLKRGEIIKTNNHWLGLKRTLTTGCGSLHVNSYWDPTTGELRECFLSKGSTGGCQLYMIGLSRMISLAARGGVGIEDILDQLKSCGVCPSYAVRNATKKDCSKGSCCPVAVGNALREMSEEIQDIICDCNEGKTIYFNSSGQITGSINPVSGKPWSQVFKEREEATIYIGESNYIDLKDIPKKEGQTYSEALKATIQNLEECPACHEKTLTRVGGCIQCVSCGYSKCN